ncbi:MAG: leucine-rich repeat protein [Clostridia bacterium]|nr:leucine-rich repeat protein [Clostridia bacterium]
MKKLLFLILIILLCLTSFMLVSCDGEEDTTTVKPPEFSITYELNGGTNNTENPNGYNTGDTVSLAFPERADYMFAGWYTDSALTSEIKEIKDKEESLTLYAKWIPYDDVFEFYEGTDYCSIRIAPDYEVETIIIPSKYNSLPVTKISSLFKGKYESVKAVIIPDSVVSIDLYAFVDGSIEENVNLSYIGVNSNNPYFKSVDGVLYSKDGKILIKYPPCKDGSSFTVPEGVESINECAFSRNKNLKNVIIPNTVTSIGIRAFMFSEALEDIVIPNSVTKVEYAAFSKCKSLRSVTLSNSMESIEYGTFESCSVLESIVIPKSVKEIKSWAFDGCSTLESIKLSNGLTTIGYGAFHNCTFLKSIEIPNSTRTIQNMAFSNCTSLESIVIPDSVSTVEVITFHTCPNLTIYCKAEEKPEGWDENWSTGIKEVVWGYKENHR